MYKPLLEKYDYIKKYPARKCYPPNLGAVDLGRAIFRGGAPNRGDTDLCRVLKCLKRKGVQTVIILNKTEQNVNLEEELQAHKEIGLDFLKVDWNKLVAEKKSGTDKQWKQIKKLMDAGGVYIHCIWGVDRTGAVVGRYRKEKYKWPNKDIHRELTSFGWGRNGTVPREELGDFGISVFSYCGCPISAYKQIGGCRNV